MSSDWQTFLKNIAVAKCLTPEQTETLLQKFPSPHETNTQTKVGMELGIEGSSVQARLAEIYTKFEISGKGTKTQKLQTILQTEFHQSSQPQVAEARTAAISLEQMKRACYDLLERQKRLNTNYLMTGGCIEFKPDDLFVPLGLVERRNRPRRQDIEASDQGSQLYGVTEEEVTQTFSHQDFFEQVIRDGSTPKSHGQRLAIIGEPGAGKTTLLQRIGNWLREHDQVPIWISLANIGTNPLREYLLEDWLRDASRAIDAVSPDWKATLEQLLKTGQVCLLLDGVDEMTIPQALRWIGEQLGEGWAASVRVVLTCRLNVWESAALPGFDVYRNLDFDYPDQVQQFIDQFFQREGADPNLGQALKAELEKPGKERIRDSVKNPLRLSLLCYTWELGMGELPDTKAELYRQFVEAFYTLKQREFPISPDEQETLNQALGDLAREAIDRSDSHFRLRESFIQQFLGHPDQEESLFSQARRMGWLNEIGITADKPYEAAYAFLHPTFQEYFASLTISTHRYFLQARETLIDSSYSTGRASMNRVLNPEWTEVIKLWLSRNKSEVDDSEKEDLIKYTYLLEPDDNDLLSIHAIVLSLKFMEEYRHGFDKHELLRILMDYSFGVDNYPKEVSDFAIQSLFHIRRDWVIESLIKRTLFDQEGRILHSDVYHDWILEDESRGGGPADIHEIQAKHRELEDEMSDDFEYYFDEWFDSKLHWNFRWLHALEVLASIAQGDERVGNHLKNIVTLCDQWYYRYPNDLMASLYHLWASQDSRLVYDIYWHTSDEMDEEYFQQYYVELIRFFNRPWLSEKNKSKRLPLYKYQEIVFRSIPEKDLLQKLEVNLLTSNLARLINLNGSPETIGTEMKAVSNIYILPIKMNILAGSQSTISVMKSLWSRLSLGLFPDEAPQKIEDFGDFELALGTLKARLKSKAIVIIMLDTVQHSELVNICDSISDIIYIGWVTDQPIACNTIRTFHPDSTDLLSAIQSWLDEISQ